jgi:acyl carrier protein
VDQIEDVIAEFHAIAAEMARASEGQGAALGDADNLLAAYDLSSVDVLEFLLIVEERFGMTFEDEDLTEEMVSSAKDLASYVMKAAGSG